MEKVCIFCGKKPQNKNKEHVIPKWLMKMTNRENLQMSVGSNWKTGEEIIFNFSSFTFPSCTKCNSDFANVESLVKPTVEKILDEKEVSTEELIRLLDWFDKIRISLWLGIQYLNNGVFNLDPKYYVNERVGLKDRFLAITNTYDEFVGLRWTGANTLCFIYNPTCVTLKINHVIFTNCSSDFIISQQLGFPYTAFERPNPNSPMADFFLLKGTEKTKGRFFKSNLYSPNIIISQPIFSVGKTISNSYENDYVKSNSYDYDKGIGKIFITHDYMTYPMEYDEEISFADEKSKKPKNFKFNRPTLEFQIELLTTKKYNLDLLNDEQKKLHYDGLNYIVNNVKEQIRLYDY